MGATINANDILHTIANNITGSTLSPGAAANAGATAKGQELNAYSKAYKIITQNAAYINSKSGTDTAAGDLIEELFFGHQDAAEDPYTTGSGGSYGGTSYNVDQGANYANGFNALFIANAIDQFRQIDGVTATSISDAGVVTDAFPYRITQAQSGSPSAMTITLTNSDGNTPTATAGVHIPFRVKSGTAAASLKLGRTEYGSAVAATTLTLDAGSTLGMANNAGDSTVESTLYIYAINNAGTINLGIINGQKLDESILHTSTALDGTADSATTLYSDSAITACAVRLLGRMRLSRNDTDVYDEDPVELSVIGIGGSGSAGELGQGEKIYWQDTNQFIQGNLTSITIESDDTFTVNSDTLARINSDTKAELVAPAINATATSTANINTPSLYATGNVALTSATSHLNIGSATWASGVDLYIEKSAPVFEMKTSDTSNSDDAKRSRIIINSDADETMFEIDVKKEGTGDDAKSEVIFKNRGAAATPAFMTVNNTQDVTFGANVSIPNLAVSGTTTTINSTVTTYVDPIIELHTASGGGAPGTVTTKDVGISMNYHTGSAAKKAFAGWDDSAEKFIFVADATESGTQVISGTAGTIHANFTVPDDGTIGSASDSDAIAIASSGIVTFSQSPVIGGTTPKLTIGDAGAEDTMLVFDGNATDVRLGIRDSTDLFEIGTGTTHGTTPAITINTSQVVNFPNNPQFGGTAIGSTAAELNLLDGSAKSTSSITLADADGFIVIDGTTTKQIPASDIKTYAATTYFGGTASSVALAIGQSPSTTDTDTGLFSAAANRIAISAGGTQRLEANTTGVHVTSLTETSSRELKTNITPLNNSLDKIMALQGVNFEWKDESQGKQIGLIADDVAKVVPEVVQFNDKSPTSLQYSKMVALLIEGMKEQQNEINKLKKLVSKSK